MDKKQLLPVVGIILGLLAMTVGPVWFLYLGIPALAIGILSMKINPTSSGLSLVLGFSAVLFYILLGPNLPYWMTEYNVALAMIGYCFTIANVFIGISRIKDLDELKQQLGLAKMHKYFGRIETIFFMLISAICIIFPLTGKISGGDPSLWDFSSPVAYHNIIGGFIAFSLFLVKLIPAFHYKDTIYKKGKILGPIGFIAWSLGYWTSITNFFIVIVPGMPNPPLVLKEPLWVVFVSLAGGIILYMYAKNYNMRLLKSPISPSTHGVALILHGIAFGYENAAKELVGAPVLYKYVYPYTYKSLDKLAVFLGVDVEKLYKMEINDALEYYMGKCAEIGMAEKIKVKFTDKDTFSVESINCSTAVVRSKIPSAEIEGSICPWALLAASLVNSITGKELEINATEFNEIGAKTTCKIKEKDSKN